MSGLKPGMKVRCLKDVHPKKRGQVREPSTGEKWGHAKDANYPIAGSIYTIRHVNPVYDRDDPIILLEEVRNSHLVDFIIGHLEPGFAAKYFEIVSAPTSHQPTQGEAS